MLIRRSFVLAFFLCFTICMLAQEWAPPGTRWYYSQRSFSPNVGVHVMEVIGDTIINGRDCRVLENAESCSVRAPFVYLEDRRIYYYNEYTESFHVLYDFNLKAGDTLKVFIKEEATWPDTFYARIDSVGSVLINNDTIQVQYISNLFELNEGLKIGQEIYENIGSNFFFVPVYGFCDIPASPLRCYEDPNRGLYQFITEFTCDHVPIEEKEKASLIKLNPNPTYGEVNISSSEQVISEIEVFDLNGRVSSRIGALHHLNYTLQSADLPKGIYFVRILFTDSRTAVHKFIRM